MLARCPNCRATFSTDRTGRQECPSCNKPLLVPEPAPAPPAPPAGFPDPALPPPAGEPQAAPPPPGEGTPWERRAGGSALVAWKDTLVMALFEPGRLFSQARVGDKRSQITFAVITGTLGLVVSTLINLLLPGFHDLQLQSAEQLSQAVLHKPLTPQLREMLITQTSTRVTLLGLLAAPLVVLVFTLLNAGFTHLMALLFGQSRRGFDATFAAATYGLTPLILVIAPGCGEPVGIVWSVVLIGIGLKQLHGISSAGAVGVSLAPYLLCCCLGCGFVGLLASAAVSSLQLGQ